MKKNKILTFFDKNFFLRSLTVLALSPVLMWLVVHNHFLLGFLVVLALLTMITEWTMVVFRCNKSNAMKLAFLFTGVCYIVFASYAICLLHLYSNLLSFSLLIIIWSTDIGAYFVGKLLGGAKLAPTISPNKTRSGAIGGLIFATIAALFLSHYLLHNINLKFVLLFLLFSVLGQIGDLFESAVKRYFNIKDTGNILPGHGGVIDRLDSLLFVGTVILILYITIGFPTIFSF